MEIKSTDTGLSHTGSIIDVFLSLVNSASLIFQFDQSRADNTVYLRIYASIEHSVCAIERRLQDFNDEQGKKHKKRSMSSLLIGHDRLYQMFIVVTFVFRKRQFEISTIEILSTYLNYLSRLLNSFTNVSDYYGGLDQILPNPSYWKQILESYNTNLNVLLNETADVAQYDDSIVKELLGVFLITLAEVRVKIESIGNIHATKPDNTLLEKEYTVTLTFSTDSKNASQVSYVIWVLSTGLETITDVNVKLVDWGRGSFWVKLAIVIKGWVSKKEVFSLLKKTILSLYDHYRNPNKDKNEVEVALLRSTLERLPSLVQSEELHNIDIKNKKLEHQDKQLDIQLKKLKVIKETTALFKDAIIRIDSDFNISIDETLICTKKDGKFEVGEGFDNLGNEDD